MNLKKLGRSQRRLLWLMTTYKHLYILRFENLSNCKVELSLRDADNSYEDVKGALLDSLGNRNLLDVQNVYNTVQPDTAHYHISLKKEAIEPVKQALKRYNSEIRITNNKLIEWLQKEESHV